MSKKYPLSKWLPPDYENEIYKPFIKKMNSLGFSFKIKSGCSDVIDEINRIIVEIKLGKDVAEEGASQILYEIEKNKLKDLLYIGLADSEMFHVFKSPEYGNILVFAKELDDSLTKPPSSFSGKKITDALVFLGKPIWIGLWKSTKDDISKILKGNSSIPFIAENLFDYHRIFGLYNIKTTDIISAFTNSDVTHVEVTKNRIIISRSEGDPIVISFKGEMKLTHKWILERLRIPDIKAVEILRQTSDRLQTDSERVKRGAYYTEQLLSMKMGGEVLRHVKPDFIIDPYAGAGSLLIPFIDKVSQGWVNDVDSDAVSMLTADYGSIGYKVTCNDLIKYPIDKVLEIIGNAKEPLFITNPPFSSTSGKKLKEISYNGLGEKYGRGNQIYPTMGKVIEIMKQLKRGYLAFFCPMGIFCERKTHMKFLAELLNNFTFIEGFIWNGKHFNDVKKEATIAFTIWKFGGSTDLEKIQFDCEDYGTIGFKRQPLLKDGWRYDERENIINEIAVQSSYDFTTPIPRIFHSNVQKGGSEVIPKNVKKSLNIQNIPDELAYALWSTCVGQKSIIRAVNLGRPTYVDGAYTHLPDFNLQETKEILAYALLNAFIAPDYTEGKIGFIGMRKVMKFGNSKELNDGARYLFKTYGHLSVGEQIISKVLDEIKNGKKKDNWFQEIVKEICYRLDVIGYWDYIPLPMKNDKIEKEKNDHWFNNTVS